MADQMQRAARIAGNCVPLALLRVVDGGSEQPTVVQALARLPPELQIRIADFAFPCAFTRQCIIVGVTSAITTISAGLGADSSYTSSRMPSISFLLGQPFYSLPIKAEEPRAVMESSFKSVLQVFDAHNCVKLQRYEDDTDTLPLPQRHRWYKRTLTLGQAPLYFDVK
ncbi:hypothetical protein LTR22_028088, partial [Elasticomyces elasticus]